MSDEPPWAAVLSVERVCELHAEGIRRHGDAVSSTPKANCVEGGLGNAYTTELYQDDSGEPFGLWFVAALLVYLNRAHCFTNGNKRVAWLCLTDVLARVHRLDVVASFDEAKNLCEDVVANRQDTDDVVAWLSEPGRLQELKEGTGI